MSPLAPLAPLAQCALMAAVVATLLYFPVGVALALAFRLLGVSFAAFLSFGGALNLFVGIAVWWLLFFAGALVYAACLFPWGDKVLGWPKKR
jgi:hypothetical protein